MSGKRQCRMIKMQHQWLTHCESLGNHWSAWNGDRFANYIFLLLSIMSEALYALSSPLQKYLLLLLHQFRL